MGERLSASIAIFGEKLATTTITCVSITSRGNLVHVVVRPLNALLLHSAVRIFVPIVRNFHRSEVSRQSQPFVMLSDPPFCPSECNEESILHWSEKSRRAVHLPAREICKRHIYRCWNASRLTSLEIELKRNVTTIVTRRMLI